AYRPSVPACAVPLIRAHRGGAEALPASTEICTFRPASVTWTSAFIRITNSADHGGCQARPHRIVVCYAAQEGVVCRTLLSMETFCLRTRVRRWLYEIFTQPAVIQESAYWVLLQMGAADGRKRARLFRSRMGSTGTGASCRGMGGRHLHYAHPATSSPHCT